MLTHCRHEIVSSVVAHPKCLNIVKFSKTIMCNVKNHEQVSAVCLILDGTRRRFASEWGRSFKWCAEPNVTVLYNNYSKYNCKTLKYYRTEFRTFGQSNSNFLSHFSNQNLDLLSRLPVYSFFHLASHSRLNLVTITPDPLFAYGSLVCKPI